LLKTVPRFADTEGDAAMTLTNVSGSTACAVCSGKGWLPIRLDSLPIPGWTEMLCRACSGNGETADVHALPDAFEAA
jgi:hypothetical protein